MRSVPELLNRTGCTVEETCRRNLDAGGARGSASRLVLLASVVGVAVALTGCASDGLDLFGSAKPDRSVSTSAVQPSRSTDAVSDEMTVTNAVTSADMAKIGSNPIPWANASTGSAGVITTVLDENQNGIRCRQFRTTRHSYMGIAKFLGRTCLEGNGSWKLMSFQEEG